MYSHIVQSGRVSEQKAVAVLVHGLGGNLHSWDVVASLLEKRFDVIRYDLRGHGQSDTPPGPWVLDDFIDDLEAVLDRVNANNIKLVGFSLGGLILQGFALRRPERVDQLAIISAVAGRTEAEREKVVQRVRNLEKGDLNTNIELAMERWFSPEFRLRYPERVQHRIDALKANDPTGYLNAYRVFGLGDLADQLHKINIPTLIMTGEFDPGSNVRMAKLMHQEIAGSQLVILPNLRHSVLVEAPELIARKLNAFL